MEALQTGFALHHFLQLEREDGRFVGAQLADVRFGQTGITPATTNVLYDGSGHL
jgi:hypothetical protein